MEERQATIDAITHPIDPPFMVIATQNPIEYEGTYPLPEAQLDRFMMRLSLGYPSAEAEENIIHEQTSHDPLAELHPVLHGSEVLAMTQAVTRVRVAPALRSYVVDLMTATRQQREIYLGASPRAGISLTRAAKALALLRGRDFVVPKDIKDLAVRVPGPPAHALPRRQGPRGDGRDRGGQTARDGAGPADRGVDRCLAPQAAASESSASPSGPTWRGGCSGPGSCTSSRSPSRRCW